MKIVLVNYRYFVSGGPERYLFNLKALLESRGHEVVPFSIRYEKNEKTEYDRYFVSPLSKESEVYFREQSWNFSTLVKTLARSFYSREVYAGLDRLLREQKPDAAIVLHYLRKLSPAVLSALDDNHIPFVVRISDFAMICPNAHLIRNNAICELCVGKRGMFDSVRYACVQGSKGASLVNYLAMGLHRLMKTFNRIPCFIVPSNFTKGKMIEAGWDERRLRRVATFVFPETIVDARKSIDVLFVGRLERIKGVDLLLDALYHLKKQHGRPDLKVVIVGDGEKQYVAGLEERIRTYGLANVVLAGRKSKGEILEYFGSSRVSVVPSLWYDNMPNSVLESFACGVPVIAPRHGSFLELLDGEKNGLFFEPSNSEDLATKIKQALDESQQTAEMGRQAFRFIQEEHSPEGHYQQLMEAIESARTDNRHR